MFRMMQGFSRYFQSVVVESLDVVPMCMEDRLCSQKTTGEGLSPEGRGQTSSVIEESCVTLLRGGYSLSEVEQDPVGNWSSS
jgi:hypothetical protein